MAGTSTNAKNRTEQTSDRSKRAANSIATGHALRTLVEAEMVGIHSAGSAANVRRMRRETVLTRFRGDARDTPPDLEDRTSASVVIDFERNERPTPEQSDAVGQLETALAKDPRSAAAPVPVVIQTRRVGVETRAAQALNKFIDDFERVFGKEVIFLRSGTDRVLPFDGVILPERPNTIFLDADGDGNVLALLGQHSQMTKSEAMEFFLRGRPKKALLIFKPNETTGGRGLPGGRIAPNRSPDELEIKFLEISEK